MIGKGNSVSDVQAMGAELYISMSMSLKYGVKHKLHMEIIIKQTDQKSAGRQSLTQIVLNFFD